jgi:uncharacterized protein HemX
MNERERLLAEGPRVAPEPPTADDSMRTTPTTPRPSPAPTAPQDRAKKLPRGLVRLFPLAVFGVVLAANAGAGKYAVWVIVAIALGTGLLRFARKAGK